MRRRDRESFVNSRERTAYRSISLSIPWNVIRWRFTTQIQPGDPL
jgi:hypothetical protein